MSRFLRPLVYFGSVSACVAFSLTVLPAEPAANAESRDARRADAFQKAYVLERQQNYAGAIEALRSVPRDSHGYLASHRLAWLYYYAGNYANSRREFALASRISPTALEPWVAQQLPLLAQQRYGEVEQTARQAMSVDPNHYYSNLRQSYACRLQGKYGPAEKLNRRMLTLYPTDLNFLLEQAQTLLAEGEAESARLCLLDVLRVSPWNTFAKTTLAGLMNGQVPGGAVQAAFAKAAELEAQGQYEEAIRQLAAVTPDRNEAYFHQLRLGWLNYLAGEYETSQRNYERAANLAPKAVEPLLGLLQPLVASNRFILTEATAREILELDPKNYTAQLRLCYALRMQQRFSEAEKAAASLRALYPSDVSLLLEEALAIEGQGRLDDARGYYRQVRLLAPDNATAQAALGGVAAATMAQE